MKASAHILLSRMCDHCGDDSAVHSPNLPRRNFLKLAGSAALSFGLFGRSQAAEISAPPKPQNVLSPAAALDRLMRGNDRYVKGKMERHDFIHERPALALGQNPFAAILGCADSRVGPEYAFDSGRGDVFVCRVAGNFADVESIASFEYAVAVLGTPLILVLGHSKCGAVDAAVKSVKEGKEFPGHIPSLIEAIRPAVKAAQDQPGDLLENAIKQNVILNVEKLKTAGPILSKALQEGKLKVAGGVYSLDTGRVTLIG
jgi:carbonic anhydrase